MKLPLNAVQLVEFAEHPVKNLSHQQAEEFDIILYSSNSDTFDHRAYCLRLLLKLFSLKKKSRVDFFEYQVKLVKDPFRWLNSVILLLNYNWKILVAAGHQKKLIELINLAEEIRSRHPRKRNSLNSTIDGNGVLAAQLYENDYVIWNENINILVGFIYECLTRPGFNGKRVIFKSKKKMADLLIRIFRKHDGSKISRSTIQTIFTPSRVEKRPSVEKQISFDELENKYVKDSDES